MGLAAVACWLVAAAPALAETPQAALFLQPGAALAPHDPFSGLAGPVGPALVRGRAFAAGFTVVDGQGPGGTPTFAHGAVLVNGRVGRGSALFLTHAGRPRHGAPGGVSELSFGVTGAVRLAPLAAAGVSASYRRVRADAPPGGEPPDDHYLSVDAGVLAALTGRLSASLAVEGLVELRQSSPSGPAEAQPPRGPVLHAGLAYETGPYVLEAAVADLLQTRGHPVARLEARLYVAPGSGVRVGWEKPLQPSAPSRWLTGLVLRLPGLGWGVSYAYLAGGPYGGVHQLALVTRET